MSLADYESPKAEIDEESAGDNSELRQKRSNRGELSDKSSITNSPSFQPPLKKAKLPSSVSLVANYGSDDERNEEDEDFGDDSENDQLDDKDGAEKEALFEDQDECERENDEPIDFMAMRELSLPKPIGLKKRSPSRTRRIRAEKVEDIELSESFEEFSDFEDSKECESEDNVEDEAMTTKEDEHTNQMQMETTEIKHEEDDVEERQNDNEKKEEDGDDDEDLQSDDPDQSMQDISRIDLLLKKRTAQHVEEKVEEQQRDNSTAASANQNKESDCIGGADTAYSVENNNSGDPDCLTSTLAVKIWMEATARRAERQKCRKEMLAEEQKQQQQDDVGEEGENRKSEKENVNTNNNDKADNNDDVASEQNESDDSDVEPSLPPPPPGSCSPSLEQKINESLLNENFNVSTILNNKFYRNPSIYEKLVEFLLIDERGTNFPKAVYDPDRFEPRLTYQDLARAQEKLWEEEKKRAPPSNSSATANSATASSAASKNQKNVVLTASTAVQHGSGKNVTAPFSSKKRVSKWDSTKSVFFTAAAATSTAAPTKSIQKSRSQNALI